MISLHRTRAVLQKEIRDYRRNRLVVATMCLLPVVLLIAPILLIFVVPPPSTQSTLDSQVGAAMFFLLIVPATLPSVIAAYSVVGEREQGTLEPILTTPMRREEFLLGKALGAWIPSLAIAYAILGGFLLCAELFARSVIAHAVFRGPVVLAEVLFMPLLAGWSIWVCLAISARANDVRVAQQLGSMASLPPLAVTALITLGVLHPSVWLALALGGGLLAFDLAALRLVSGIFDRERLITGKKATIPTPAWPHRTRKADDERADPSHQETV